MDCTHSPPLIGLTSNRSIGIATSMLLISM